MKVKLVPSDGGRDLHIPQSVVEASGLGEEVDLRVEGDTVVLGPPREVRKGWAEAFERMAAAGDDAPLFPDDMDHEWDDENWTW